VIWLWMLGASVGNLALAQDGRSSDLVAPFESTSVRSLLAKVGEPQGYGGLAAGGTVQLQDSFALPLGAGVGVTDWLEGGVDLGLGVRPFDALERARLYSRVGLVDDHVALQLGTWLPTEAGGSLGVELLLPVRWVGDGVQVFGQARSLVKPGADTVVVGAGASGMGRLGRLLWVGLDVGAAQLWADQTSDLMVAAGVHAGVEVGASTMVRVRWSFSDLTAREDDWSGLDARAVELVVMRRFGGRTDG
jgi:hypothetical protein